MIPTLLWAGMGFSVNRHYCLGMLKSEAFYSNAAPCSELVSTEVAEKCEKENLEACEIIEDWSCCDSEWLNVKAVQVLVLKDKASSQMDERLPISAPLFFFALVKLNSLSSAVPQVKLYRPYPVPWFYNGKDILIKVSRFLI
jgi:hypothetical protein